MVLSGYSTLGSAKLIGSYTHLPDQPRSQHALTLLRRIASLVKPLMQRHSLRVGQLVEMAPAENPQLLGLNYDRGSRIVIKLRHHNDPYTFFSEDQIMDTMLHELTHNTFGPHDEKFYGLLERYKDEYEKLRKSGWNGEGFYSEGKRLGGRRIPILEIRRRAVDAAEKRRRLTQGSGQSVGRGRDWARVETPQQRRERLARAAERRAKDSVRCGAQRGLEKKIEMEIAKGVETKADDDDEQWLRDVVEAIRIFEEEERRVNEGGMDGFATSNGETAAPPLPPRPESADQWACPICTLVNPWNYLQCDACGLDKPMEPPRSASTGTGLPRTPPTSSQRAGRVLSDPNRRILEETPGPKKEWRCHQCHRANEHMFWMCSGCGEIKKTS